MTDIGAINPRPGSRVYVVIESKFTIVPAVVVEKISRETAEGVYTSFILNFGTEGRERISSDQVKDSRIVATPHEARMLLMQHARMITEEAIARAVKNGDDRFGAPEEPHDQSDESLDSGETSHNTAQLEQIANELNEGLDG